MLRTQIEVHVDKFDEKGVMCILVGYATEHKGYILFDLDKRKVIISRDVIFQDDIIPFLVTDINQEGRKKLVHFPEELSNPEENDDIEEYKGPLDHSLFVNFACARDQAVPPDLVVLARSTERA